VFKFRSVNNIVIPPAKTGKDKINKIVVNNKLQTYKGNRSNVMLEDRIFEIVLIKLIDPKIEEAPAKCNLKIAKSTQFPLCPKLLDKGG
jgi:hypothetical protein